MTSTAMLLNILSLAREGDWFLFVLGGVILALEIWMVVEGIRIFRALSVAGAPRARPAATKRAAGRTRRARPATTRS